MFETWRYAWNIFASSHVNKPEFAYAEYLITFLNGSIVLQKNISKLLWIHVFHKFKGMFRYDYFFYFSFWRRYM